MRKCCDEVFFPLIRTQHANKQNRLVIYVADARRCSDKNEERICSMDIFIMISHVDHKDLTVCATAILRDRALCIGRGVDFLSDALRIYQIVCITKIVKCGIDPFQSLKVCKKRISHIFFVSLIRRHVPEVRKKHGLFGDGTTDM